MILIDTNILLDYPQIIEDSNDIMISTDVLRELDGLKLSSNPDTSFKARRAAVVISHNLDKIKWNDMLENQNMKVDDKLLELCKTYGCKLITNDVYLKVKAIIYNVETEGYGIKDDYNGIKTIFIETDENRYNEWLDYVLQNQQFPDHDLSPESCYENEYFMVKDLTSPIITKDGKSDYELLTILYYENGSVHQLPQRLEIRNNWISKIHPKNDEQKCLFHALSNRDISIIYAGGCFGSGKSFILNNFAIQELERQTIKKIVYIPNNAFTENTIDIGSLPGELLDKTVGQIGPLIDLVGIDQIKDWINTEQLEVVPMSFVRGRSFQDSIIIVNEAQNLTEDHIKLLIGRCGEGTRIFFDGDFKQADSNIFRNKNGLKLLLKLRKSEIYSKIFATVKLETVERSITARASEYLDSLMGSI